MEFQYLISGVTPGHGEQAVHAVNVLVSVAGMDIAPGEIVHMDEMGPVISGRETAGRAGECTCSTAEGAARRSREASHGRSEAHFRLHSAESDYSEHKGFILG